MSHKNTTSTKLLSNYRSPLLPIAASGSGPAMTPSSSDTRLDDDNAAVQALLDEHPEL